MEVIGRVSRSREDVAGCGDEKTTRLKSLSVRELKKTMYTK